MRSKYKKVAIKTKTKEEFAEGAQLLTFRAGGGEAKWADYLEDAELIKLLIRVGEYICQHGCRRDFETTLIDMYLRSFKNKRLRSEQTHLLRDVLGGEDAGIEPKLIEPRLQILRDKIENLILNHLTS